MNVLYKPTFLRQLKKLPPKLQEEAKEKIILFKDIKNHPALRVHKLHGPLQDRHSFSVNFRYRIVFKFTNEDTAVLLSIGDHVVYD